MDQSDDFDGFDFKYIYSSDEPIKATYNPNRKRFTETENQAILKRVITETKALDETIALSQIKGTDPPGLMFSGS